MTAGELLQPWDSAHAIPPRAQIHIDAQHELDRCKVTFAARPGRPDVQFLRFRLTDPQRNDATSLLQRTAVRSIFAENVDRVRAQALQRPSGQPQIERSLDRNSRAKHGTHAPV